MRLAIRYLTLILIAVTVVGIIGMGVGLVGRHPSNVAGVREQSKVVFVDLDRLTKLHPGWEAVQIMKATAAEVGAAEGRAAGTESSVDITQLDVPDMKAQPAAPRWKLEESAARRADAALAQLEAEQMEALKARVAATRKTMADSAESDIRIRAYEIEQAAAGKISGISQQRVYDRINLRLKVASLKGMIGKLGVVDDDVKRKLEIAERELAASEKELAGNVGQVDSDTRKTVGELQSGAESTIDAALRNYAERENRDIADRIRDARNQVISDVCSLDEISAPDAPAYDRESRAPARVGVAEKPVMGLQPVYDAGRDASDLRGRAMMMEERIRRDVADTVRKLADGRKVRVVFKRSDSSVPDETSVFAQLVKNRGWRLGEPVIHGSLDT